MQLLDLIGDIVVFLLLGRRVEFVRARALVFSLRRPGQELETLRLQELLVNRRETGRRIEMVRFVVELQSSSEFQRVRPAKILTVFVQYWHLP
jgi:hypothetical protein